MPAIQGKTDPRKKLRRFESRPKTAPPSGGAVTQMADDE